MSEYSGGSAPQRLAVSDDVVEVRFLFESQDYGLDTLARRFQDVDALVSFLLAPQTVINGQLTGTSGFLVHRKFRKAGFRGRRARMEESVQRAFSPAALSQEVRTIRKLTDGKVTVESLSLHSPMEVILLIGASTAALGSIVKLLPKLIAVKNDWNDSRVQRAEANLQVKRLELEQRAIEMVAEELEDINLETYFGLPDNHPSKQIVKMSIRALSHVDKAEAKGK